MPVEILLFFLQPPPLSRFEGGPADVGLEVLPLAASLLSAAAPAAWDGVREFTGSTVTSLVNGMVTDSSLSLESTSVKLIGSTADPTCLTVCWSSIGEAVHSDVLETALDLSIIGVSGIESELKTGQMKKKLCEVRPDKINYSFLRPARIVYFQFCIALFIWVVLYFYW